MAVKTYYLSSTDITAGTFDTLTESAPASADNTTGWNVGKNSSSSNPYGLYAPNGVLGRASFTTNEQGSTFSSKGFRTTSTVHGHFAAGTWSLAGIARSGASYYAQTGYVKARIWKGTAANGSDATQVTSGWVASSLISWTAADQNQSYS